MLRCVYVFVGLALLMLPTFAVAQRPGTPEEQMACTRDVQRFCRSVMNQGDFTILACLKENRPKISAACDQVLKSHHQ
jgi:hypothetical protein